MKQETKTKWPLACLSVLLACISVLFVLSAAAEAAESAATQAKTCDPEGKSLEDVVIPKPQETNMWCWAAVAEMVMDRYNKHVEQCVQVTDAYRDEITVRSCCDDDNRWNEECNRTGWPDFSEYDFHVDRIHGKKSGIEWKQLTDEICQDRPFIFTLEENVAGIRNSHQYVAIGYRETRKKGKEVLVINPMGYYPINADVGWMSFEREFHKDPAEGVWHGGTLLNIHPKSQ